jgi:phospholipase C
MTSRRDFIKKATLLSGVGSVAGVLPPSIQRAFAIDPKAGTTWQDAEHVVILMQENRSFDHCYGTLRGVRGFGDPRAITLPDNKPVFFQTNGNGETYAPFRLNIKDTRATWMGSLPHGWTDQVDARNGGKYDQWLIAKQPGQKEYSHMPLTLGYYNREDLPFYYSLADAFTVCDQNFCSSLTGTTPNRLYLWSGKIREDNAAAPRVRNEEADYGAEAQWITFPERLEESGISWKIYQNEISVGNGFDSDQDAWLSNFTDNAIEWFSQYHVRFHAGYIKYLPRKIKDLEKEIADGKEKLEMLTVGSADYTQLQRRIERATKRLETSNEEIKVLTPENFDKLSRREKEIHKKAFTTNAGDPNYHELTTVTYNDAGTTREMKVPKGDVLHQFRTDVKNGTLPTVSWLVAPENFSDHPGAPWYGAWYLSEAMDILTKDPEVWKKTIFILCYDENDGYFDHVPPFVPPRAGRPESGLASSGIDLETEYVPLEQDLKRKDENYARGGPIGLGYRVPLVVASPWSRGGSVCSQVFDHTSILMFLEKFVSHKTGKPIQEANISAWRRAVCGDLTSVFKPYNGEKYDFPAFVGKDEFMESINQAQYRSLPVTPRQLEFSEFAEALPKQERGTRPSCAIPYELYVNGVADAAAKTFNVKLTAGKTFFGERSAGAPFLVYSLLNEWSVRSYAVMAGDLVSDSYNVDDRYHLKVCGPNGFMREFRGSINDKVEVSCAYDGTAKKLTGHLIITLLNGSDQAVNISVKDNAYGSTEITRKINANGSARIVLDLSRSYSWYDASVTVRELRDFGIRLCGHVESGRESVSDPAIGA